MYKNIFAWMTIWFAIVNCVIIPPSKAYGMTAEEAVKLLDTVKRSISEIDKIFNPAPKTPQPETSTPKSDTENSQPTPDTNETRSN
jgi:hypothetical protein